MSTEEKKQDINDKALVCKPTFTLVGKNAFGDKGYGGKVFWRGKDRYVPYGVWATGAPILWTQGITGKGVKVAIIDTGVDVKHPDLKVDTKLSKNFRDTETDTSKWDTHGTHVAGTVAACGKILGVAPDATIIDLRVIGDEGATFEDLIKAINYAVKIKVDVINMSLGGTYNYKPFHDAIKAAVKENIMVVCAAGNEGDGNDKTIETSYPGSYSEVLGVGAVSFDQATGKVHSANFTNTNPDVDVASTGVDVLSTFPLWSGTPYHSISGTSMACPHVTGFCALMIDKFRQKGIKWNYEAMYDYVKASTVDIGLPGLDLYTGAGFVTAYPELASRSGSNTTWSLPNMPNGAPK